MKHLAFLVPALFVVPTVAEAADPVAPPPVFVPPPPPEPAFAPISYFSIEGGPVTVEDAIREFTILPSGEEVASNGFGEIPSEEGFYFGFTYRRLFQPMWDWQIALTGTWTDTSDTDPLGDLDADQTMLAELGLQTLDLDAGFHPGGNPLTRILAGVRVLHADDFVSHTHPSHFGFWDAESWLIGPRIGFQSELPLGSRFALVAEASGSVLFGNTHTDGLISFTIDPDIVVDSNEGRTVTNLEGLVGLALNFTPNAALTVGYRAQQWWGLRDGTSAMHVTSGGATLHISPDPDPLIHGPFARLSITFGGP